VLVEKIWGVAICDFRFSNWYKRRPQTLRSC